MEYLTDEILRNVINNIQQNEFDSHDVIKKLLQPRDKGGYQKEYVLELKRYIDDFNGNDPIKQLHMAIGQKLSTFDDIIKQIGEQVSHNIRCEETPNALWQKV